jgi:hypothetical protein
LAVDANNRSEGRSNVFLTATLDSGKESIPVRIRNLSSNGALIDGSALPPAGAKVRLKRGRLSASGELAWEVAGHAGVTFESEIDVDEWVRRVGHAGQQRVDRVLAALQRFELVPDERQAAPGTETLESVSAALDQVCRRLAAMPDMSAELGETIVRLDAIAETLRCLATGRKGHEPPVADS